MWYNEILGNRNKTLHLAFSYWASLWYHTKKSLISFKSYNNVDTTHQRLLGHVMHVNVNHVELWDTLLPGNLHVNCPTNANTFSENEYTILTMLVCRYCSLLSSYVSGKGEIWRENNWTFGKLWHAIDIGQLVLYFELTLMYSHGNDVEYISENHNEYNESLSSQSWLEKLEHYLWIYLINEPILIIVCFKYLYSTSQCDQYIHHSLRNNDTCNYLNRQRVSRNFPIYWIPFQAHSNSYQY